MNPLPLIAVAAGAIGAVAPPQVFEVTPERQQAIESYVTEWCPLLNEILEDPEWWWRPQNTQITVNIVELSGIGIGALVAHPPPALERNSPRTDEEIKVFFKPIIFDRPDTAAIIVGYTPRPEYQPVTVLWDTVVAEYQGRGVRPDSVPVDFTQGVEWRFRRLGTTEEFRGGMVDLWFSASRAETWSSSDPGITLPVRIEERIAPGNDTWKFLDPLITVLGMVVITFLLVFLEKGKRPSGWSVLTMLIVYGLFTMVLVPLLVSWV